MYYENTYFKVLVLTNYKVLHLVQDSRMQGLQRISF